MTDKLIALIGKSASGKTTLAKMLFNEGYSKVVTYTTRPMRDGEMNGVDYNFVSKDYFDNMVKLGCFAEYQDYKVDKEVWRYGTTKNSLRENENSVIIVEINGLYELKSLNIPMISIFIDMDDKERWKRQIDRGDDILEVALREVRDKTPFEHAKRNVDYVINNDGTEQELLENTLRIIEEDEHIWGLY